MALWALEIEAVNAESYRTRVARSQRTIGGRLRAKREAAQEREALLACQLLNQMRELGRPQSYPVC